MPPTDLHLLAAKYVLRDVAPEARSAVAAQLAASGTPLPTRLDAATRLKRHHARAVAEGRVDPARGALEILRVFGEIRGELPETMRHDSDTFGIWELHLVYDEYEDLDEGDHMRRTLSAALRAECVRIAAEDTEP